MSDPASHRTIDRIIAALQAYLALHPDAEDTAEGIANWWIPAPHREAFMPLIGLALDSLVKRGVLTRRDLPEGRCVYSSATKAAARPVPVEPKRK
jgi:hypothetical protein